MSTAMPVKRVGSQDLHLPYRTQAPLNRILRRCAKLTFKEPHVLLFRRPKDYDAQNQPLATNTGLANRMVNIAG